MKCSLSSKSFAEYTFSDLKAQQFHVLADYVLGNELIYNLATKQCAEIKGKSLVYAHTGASVVYLRVLPLRGFRA